MLLPVKQIKHKIILRKDMGILEVIISIEFPQCVAIKDHFLYIYKKIAKCSGRKQKFLFTRSSPLATPALGKLYLRKTRIWRFVRAKESMETYPACQRLFMHGFRFFKSFIATRGFGPRAEGSRHQRENLWYPG